MARGSGIRPWKRGTETQRAGRSDVLPSGDLVVTDEGNVYAGDGTSILSALKRLVRLDEVTAAVQQYVTSLVVTNSSLSTLASTTGYVWALLDSAGRIALGVKPDGTVDVLKPGSTTVQAIIAAITGSGSALPTSQTAAGVSYVITDSAGRKGFWLTGDGALEAAKLGPTFQALVVSALTTAGFDAAAETFKSSYAATTTKVVSGPNVTLVGHSMLAQSASAITTALAGTTGATVTSLAVGGETSRTIAARHGGQPATFAVVGGQIPATVTAVEVKLNYADKVPLTDADGGWPLLQGAASYLGSVTLPDGTKVPGTFSVVRDAAATPNQHHAGDKYYFTRTTAGSVLTADRRVPFYYDAAETRREDIYVYWVGRNNISETDQVFGDLQAMIGHQRPLRARYLVLSEHNQSTELSGSGNYTAMAALNARYRLAFGRRYIDARRYLIDYGLADAGITPTSQDTTDIANDVVPSSLRGDNLHLNAAGSAVIAALVKRRALELGWIA